MMIDLGRLKISIDLVFKQSPIAISESINTLLHVAYDEIEMIGSKTFTDKRQKIVPLQRGSILKLINHKMKQTRTGFFVNERGIVFRNQMIEQLGCVRQK
ncbi:MAG: hypothetical protein BWZ06_01856 [Bacteroidetes bacterium ADurb.BinA261]|nr:MAG: hypothetical protein BWZ06_01856 [Bacteroidetes bacterium ADurb.BinA261]